MVSKEGLSWLDSAYKCRVLNINMINRKMLLTIRDQVGNSSCIKFFFFFFCGVVFLSISPLCTAAWVTFDGVGSNRACFVLQLDLWNASCLHYTSSLDVFLSLTCFSPCLNPHSLYRVSYSHLTSLRSSPNWTNVQFFERTRTHVSGRSRAGVLVDLFRFQIFDFAFRLNAMASLELAAGFDLAPFWKNEWRQVCSVLKTIFLIDERNPLTWFWYFN